MEFFGVSPLELLIIAVLGLIIFGPERLPQIGRTLGKFVARILAWQYTSPEAQMLNELRRDFEKQIVEIRDEMVYARQQLDISSDLREIQHETEALIRANPTATPTTGAASTATTSSNTSDQAAPATATSEQQAATSTSTETASDATKAPPAPANEPATSVATSATASSSPVSDAKLRSEIAALTQQIADLSTNLQSLQSQLLERGMLDPNWQEQPKAAALAAETPAKASESAETVETQPQPTEPLKVFEPAGLVDLNAKTVQTADAQPEANSKVEQLAPEAVESAETEAKSGETVEAAETEAKPSEAVEQQLEPETVEVAETEAKPSEAVEQQLESETVEAAETEAKPSEAVEQQLEPETVEVAETKASEAVAPEAVQNTQSEHETAERDKSSTELAELVEVEVEPTPVGANQPSRPQLKQNQSEEIV